MPETTLPFLPQEIELSKNISEIFLRPIACFDSFRSACLQKYSNAEIILLDLNDKSVNILDKIASDIGLNVRIRGHFDRFVDSLIRFFNEGSDWKILLIKVYKNDGNSFEDLFEISDALQMVISDLNIYREVKLSAVLFI